MNDLCKIPYSLCIQCLCLDMQTKTAAIVVPWVYRRVAAMQ